MPVPQMRKSRARTKQGRSHHHLIPTIAVNCPNCGEPVLRHRVCSACGQYRNKQVFEVKEE